jgi:hypothetical protein
MMNLHQLVDLAREVEITDPIDWGYLNIDEQSAYELIASGLLEHFNSLESDSDRSQFLLVSLVKLTVENFVLNIKLLQQQEK